MLSRHRLPVLTLSLVALFCLLTQIPTKGAGTPLDNREHPRLWLSSSTLPEIRTKLAGPLKSQFQQFVTAMDDNFAAGGGGAAGYPYAVRNYGFLYAVGPVSGISYGRSRAEYGAKAVEHLRTLAGASGVTLNIQLLAAGYDWCYPLLCASDKAMVVAKLKELAAKPYDAGTVRHSFHHVAIKERQSYILAGLTYANDGIDDADAAMRIATYAAFVTGDAGILPGHNFIAGSDGGVSSGTAYSVGGSGGDGLVINSILFTDAWRTSHGISRDAAFGVDNEFRYFPQWMAYTVLPFRQTDGSQILYSTHETDRGTAAKGFVDLSLTLAGLRLYRDMDPRMAGLAEWLGQNQMGSIPSTGVLGERSAVMGNFVLNPGSVTPQSPSTLGLPLTKLFRGLGWLVMRTGWDDPGDTVVTFTAGAFTRKPSYANHDHGSFTIDRNGPLAINAGAGIHHPFQENSRAHNMIMFTDPNEPVNSWPEYWDMGGERLLFGIPAGISAMIRGSQWDIGGIKRSDLFDNTPEHDYDYAYADITRAYAGPANVDSYNTRKVRLATRQFVNFRRSGPADSDRVIVFDRTETVSTSFEKRWQFHPPGRRDGARSFVISGGGATPGPVRNGSSAGRQTYSQPDTITITNTENGSNGRLFWKPLLPANRVLVEVGGPGHEFEDAYGHQISEAASYPPENSQFVGNYTLELQPSAKNLFDVFLNVFEATTPRQAAPTVTNLLNGAQTVGVAIGDRIAVFGRLESYVANDAFTVPRAGQYKVLICDLQPGMNYTVNGQLFVAGTGGNVYVTLSLPAGGSVNIAATGVVTPIIPRPVTGVRIVVQ